MKKTSITILILFLVLQNLLTQGGNNSTALYSEYYSPDTDIAVCWDKTRSWLTIGFSKYRGDDIIEIGVDVFDGNVHEENNNIFFFNEKDSCAFYKMNDTIIVCKSPLNDYIKKGDVFYSRILYSTEGVLAASDSGWKNGKMSGEWILTYLNGDKHIYIYEDGILIKKIEVKMSNNENKKPVTYPLHNIL